MRKLTMTRMNAFSDTEMRPAEEKALSDWPLWRLATLVPQESLYRIQLQLSRKLRAHLVCTVIKKCMVLRGPLLPERKV